MAAGLGLLRLSPAHFWAMTPKELEAALRGLIGPTHADAPLPRAALTEMMARFPDMSSSGLSRGSSHPRAPRAHG